MSARNEFKNALQALTTTVVDAEAARDSNPDTFEALRSASVAHRQLVREKHDAFVAEWAATASADPVPYAAWFTQTLARAEALFGPETASAQEVH
jgi:hypothetical protein